MSDSKQGSKNRPDQTPNQLAVFESIFGAIDAFIYRCHNDRDYTMQIMSGRVEQLCGRPARDIIGNRVIAFTDMVHEDDKAEMFEDVDKAIEARKPWDIAYRFVKPVGDIIWVRERGKAVYDENGEVIFLEGMVVPATAEMDLRSELVSTLENANTNYSEILKLAEEIIKSIRVLSLLSVNARVEAARAGESGRGFAYVAKEMAGLAEENSQRAKKITEQLQSPGKHGEAA